MKNLLYLTLIVGCIYTAGCMPPVIKKPVQIEQNIDLENKIVDFVVKDNKKIILNEDGNLKDFYNLKLGDNNIDLDKYIYLCKGNNNFYGYVQSYRNIAETDSIGRKKIIIKKEYSNKIVEIDSAGNEKFFKYAPGIPAGLFFNEEKLWYLYNSSDKNYQKSRLMCYKTDDLPSLYETPVSNATGLSVNNDNFITFDKSLKLFINFKLDECTPLGEDFINLIRELNKIK